ncbi:uncharacterized protein A4U43_C04F5530 [Asparagus officinalis]|uniref:Uncharacterized protein n=1 Tax=Asparagus officinalis TaxID=4686 RepID=A0A5P1F3Y5_ASPOF|nr:uncharacterized protein A4U43_C04F5530 [Asparagus officinalis]
MNAKLIRMQKLQLKSILPGHLIGLNVKQNRIKKELYRRPETLAPIGVEATAVARGCSDVWLGVVEGRMATVKIDKGINVWEMEEYESRVWESKKCVEMPEEESDAGDGRPYYRRNVSLF